ncbi:MAG TPA: septum formation initiator family protein [Anaerolineales bacterium]|nr:septum formation initiator family protein [Anaerolineales bacterium]
METRFRPFSDDAELLARDGESGYDPSSMDEDSSTKPRWNRFAILLLLAFGALILGDLSQRMADAVRLENDRVLLRTEVASLQEENRHLASEMDRAQGDLFVEEWARSEAKMVRPGEMLVVPVPADGDALATAPSPAPVGPSPKNWEIWVALLFGE